MMVPGVNDWVSEALAFLTGGGLGAILGYVFAPKADRDKRKQQNYENAEKRIDDLNASYKSYVNALNTYDPKGVDQEGNFIAVATAGERYFSSLNFISVAMLSGLIDKNARDRILVKRVVEAVDRTIPDHYSTLAGICQKRGFAYPAIPEWSSYIAIQDAAKQFRECL